MIDTLLYMDDWSYHVSLSRAAALLYGMLLWPKPLFARLPGADATSAFSWVHEAIVQLTNGLYASIFKMMLNMASGEIYSSISTSSPPPVALPFCREFDFGTDASLSIICLETDTMLSSMSCWPTSSMSVEVVSA
jgi:hypothetical protein